MSKTVYPRAADAPVLAADAGLQRSGDPLIYEPPGPPITSSDGRHSPGKPADPTRPRYARASTAGSVRRRASAPLNRSTQASSAPAGFRGGDGPGVGAGGIDVREFRVGDDDQ